MPSSMPSAAGLHGELLNVMACLQLQWHEIIVIVSFPNSPFEWKFKGDFIRFSGNFAVKINNIILIQMSETRNRPGYTWARSPD